MPGVGDLIGGRYRLESVIGQGALGTVMRAQHITMGREVAVKLLRPEISNHTTIRRRLIQRVHQAQRLSHPNNCRLFDFGQAGGSLYLVMELLQGATLQTVIDRGAPYPVGWVLDIGMQMLDALGEAHDNNFIHRNLKPSNIFLLPRRRRGQQVKISDYGLASSLDSLPDLDLDPDDADDHGVREGEICGSAAYLAPETLVQRTSGKPTDVYAVGLILIEMLTAKQVFGGDSLAQVLYRQIHTSVRLPPKLEWTSLGKVLMKAVSKHPGNRFQDADEFYEALEQAAETTASYFRLDERDLHGDAEAMSPQMLAQMLKKRRGRGSEDDADGDDTEDADPEPLATSTPLPGGTLPGGPSSAAPPAPPGAHIPLLPPLSTLNSQQRPPEQGGRLRSTDPDAGAVPSPAPSVTHPLRDFADERSVHQVTFPRGGKSGSEEATRLGDAPSGAARAATRVRTDTWERLWTVGRHRVARRFAAADGGWASRLPVMLVALILSMAGLGLYLVLS